MAKKNKYADWTREELIKRVTALEKRKKYGLVWDEEKTKEKFEADAEGKFPVLKEVKSKEIKTDLSQPTHILIEGDNYHALSVLSYTHERKIDLVYIDPPYNTGNNDFKFNDTFINKEDSYRHSKWLTFMYKRLKIAKNLLKESGLIVISIDDNEVNNLKLLCDELFLEPNFIALIPTIMNLKGNQDEFGFAGTHEYTLIYAKNKSKCVINEFAATEEELEKWVEDELGYYKKGAPLRATGEESKREDREKMFYPILVNKSSLEIKDFISQDEYEKIFDVNKKIFDDKHLKNLIKKYSSKYHVVLPMISESDFGRWRWGWSDKNRNKMMTDIIVNTTGSIITLYKKQRPELGELATKKPKSIFYKPEYSSSSATGFLKSIFEGEKVLNNPKPIDLISDLIFLCSNTKGTILDFFAGSGTTGHATLQLNNEDNGQRQFILCTNNENNICTDVCYPRIKKVINGYKNNKKKSIAGLGSNLKYFKTSFVPQEPTDKNKELLTKEATEMLCLREDAFEPVASNENFKIFKNDKKYLGIVLDQLSIADFKKEIKKFNKPINVYVFSLTDEDFSDEFSDLKSKIKICSIPEAILRVYRRIFK